MRSATRHAIDLLRPAAMALALVLVACSSTAERGEEGGPCQPNDTCNNERLICTAGTCELAEEIGTEGFPCYENQTCDEGLSCSVDGGGTACVTPGDGDGDGDGDCGGETCADTQLCVTINDGPTPVCADACDAEADDPCGVGFICQALNDGGQGACLQAGAEGDACPCDEGLVCIAVDNDDGNGLVQTCLRACNPMGGAPACDVDEICQTLNGDPNRGACVDA